MQPNALMVIKKTTRKIAKKYIEDYIKYLQKEKKMPIKQVYLFGSYVKNKQKNWSDIDVAVVSDKFKGKIDPYEYLWLNLRDIDVQRGIEPVGFHPKNFIKQDPLVWEIKQHGIKIKI